MNKIIKAFITLVLGIGLIIPSCKKTAPIKEEDKIELKPVYSTVQEFRSGISQVLEIVKEKHIVAYLDILSDGYPDKRGRWIPLAQYVMAILAKLDNHQVEAAVYDVFHFDGESFSLISFLMKAQMAGDISAQTLVDLVGEIPLPPIAVPQFEPPVVENIPVAEDNCCDKCNPKIKIKATWVYRPACGNYEDTVSGYAANNTLTGMSGGRMYRFDAEKTGCPCPGESWSHTVTGPAGASMGTNSLSGQSVILMPFTPGTYTITFTLKVCDKVVTQSFTLTIN